MLTKLWESSTGLIKRFGLKPPPELVLTKFIEEAGEFMQAVRDSRVSDYDLGSAAHEGVDVIVTVLNTLNAMGLNLEQIEAAMEDVIAKNDAKTYRTHEVVNGIIERIGRVR